ncbi:hypothetical protein PT974_10949 [Cladobotryum mycophilum]|uniref:Uncharacterized protein n=1 Tax=Cladobotryum mycophilum TaxID=491253 RepID=A0ABR0SC98_9HYPO
MTQKTWFLPPDFTFLPDGELALGTVIPYPSRPTLALASLGLDSHPEITLPDVKTLTEANHQHSRNFKRSLCTELFTQFAGLASVSGKVGLSRYKNTSLGNVDLETRTFFRSMSADTLKEIVAMDKVKKHIDRGLFGKRPVYIISGLRVARDSFEVVDENTSVTATSASASVSPPAEPLPFKVGGSISSSGEQGRKDGYKTAPGVVFAYRLHVIRAKRDGDVESELFSHRTAFLTGDSEDEDEEEEMECTEVTAHVVNDDLEVEPDFTEYVLEEGEESYIVFNNNN